MSTTAYFTHPDCARHDMGPGHPECPARLAAVDDALSNAGVLDRVDRRTAPLASLEALKRVHDSAYVDLIVAHAPTEGLLQLDPDTAMNAHSLDAARRAAGAGVAAVDALMQGSAVNAFCAVRPCGHHATRTRSMGFCIFNNVAVAAAHALEERGLERVAIIDFDVHHGNGTEDIFGASRWQGRTLMASFFQHPFYPYSGTEQPAANMLNVPLPARSGAAEVRAAVTHQWLPALNRFEPQMIFISAGFDAHRDDLLGGMALVEADYEWMTQQLMDVASRHAEGRIVSMLEGGYNLEALGRSAVVHVDALTAGR